MFYVGKGKNNRLHSLQRRNIYFLNIINKERDKVSVRKVKDNLNEEEAFNL